MTTAPAQEGYRDVLRLPSAKLLLAGSLIGQLPLGMVTLTLLFALAQAKQSYSLGGVMVALYVTASGVAAPFWGRRSDRRGARAALLVTGTTFVASFLLLGLLLAVRAPVWAITTAVVMAGLSRPILSGVAQTLWAKVTMGGSGLRPAYALHAMQLGLVWIAGPLLVSVLVQAFGPANGPLVSLLVAAVCSGAGALGVAGVATRLAERPAPPPADTAAASDRLYSRPYLATLASVGLFEGAAGVGLVTITLAADRSGRPSVAGLLLACWFSGALAGGLWFGRRSVPVPLARQYRCCLLALAVSYCLCVPLSEPRHLAPALLVGGLALAPTFTVMYGLIAELSPPQSLTEGFSWPQTLAATGGSLGAAVAGPVIDLTGRISAGFLLAVACLVAAAAVVAPVVLGSVPDGRP